MELGRIGWLRIKPNKLVVSNVSDIIGKRILSVRTLYVNKNKYGLQESYSFIKLDNDTIVHFPIFADELFNSSRKNVKQIKRNFKRAQEEYIYGVLTANPKIIDIYFIFDDEEEDILEKAIFKLDNGFYISENSYRPQGVPVGLYVMNELEFNSIYAIGI